MAITEQLLDLKKDIKNREHKEAQEEGRLKTLLEKLEKLGVGSEHEARKETKSLKEEWQENFIDFNIGNTTSI